MTNIYTVTFYDNYGDEHSDSLVAFWLNKDTALDYAASYPLEHEESIVIEKREEGVQHLYKVETIYQRKHYDHTQALFSSMDFCSYDYDLSYDDIILCAVEEFSPLLTAEIDFDRLYALYKEQYCYDED